MSAELLCRLNRVQPSTCRCEALRSEHIERNVAVRVRLDESSTLARCLFVKANIRPLKASSVPLNELRNIDYAPHPIRNIAGIGAPRAQYRAHGGFNVP